MYMGGLTFFRCAQGAMGMVCTLNNKKNSSGVRVFGVILDLFNKVVAEVATVELICFLCHCKDNNKAYTIVVGCSF